MSISRYINALVGQTATYACDYNIIPWDAASLPYTTCTYRYVFVSSIPLDFPCISLYLLGPDLIKIDQHLHPKT